ncbi:unnamed protein product [Discula destructiva]
MIKSLIPLIGFKYTSLSMALVVLITLGISNIIMRPALGRPQAKRAFFDPSALTDAPYILFITGCVLTFLGLYTPFFYAATYATETDVLAADGAAAAYLVTVLNAASVPGRILPNIPAVTARLGPLNMMATSVLSLSILVLCLNAAPRAPGLFVILSLYGFFTGAFFSLQPTVFGRLTADPKWIGTRMGMAATCMSFGLLLGAPSSGALMRHFGFHATWAWSGVALAMGGVAMVASRGLTGGWRLASAV